MPADRPEYPFDISWEHAGLSAEQQQQAAYYFSRYIDLVRRIFERNHDKLSNLTELRKRP
jgi:hypothetical protein